MIELITYPLVLVLMWHYLDIRPDMEDDDRIWIIPFYSIIATLILWKTILCIFLN